MRGIARFLAWLAPLALLSVAQSWAAPTISGMSLTLPKQPVLAPNGIDPINSFDGLSTLADEHTTIMLDGAGGYTFWVASRTSANTTSSGLVVLDSTGPNAAGQWTLTNNAANGPSQTFLSPLQHNIAGSGLTFDLNYAAPGTVFADPTRPGSMLMIYSATNRSLNWTPGTSDLANNAYNSVAVATGTIQPSGAVVWPSYANFGFPPPAPPAQSTTTGPISPAGGGAALGSDVCAGFTGTTCNPNANPNYGRYPVLQAPLPSFGAAGTGIPGNQGDGSPSAFVDVFSKSATTYVYPVDDYNITSLNGTKYVTSSELVISRAAFNGGTAPLDFQRWNGAGFAGPGIVGAADPAPAPIGFLPGPNTLQGSCEGPNQIQTAGSISYVPVAAEYLLTFACISPAGFPFLNQNGQSAAWFFASNTSLDNENDWTQPQEIANSWAPIDNSAGCDSFDGWYPSFMSQGEQAGVLNASGYAFFMDGCRGDPTANSGRTFESAGFTIDVTGTEVPEAPSAMLLGTTALLLLAVRHAAGRQRAMRSTRASVGPF